MINRKETPAIIDAVDFKLRLQPTDFFTLDNGVPVYAVNAGEQDVLQLEWVFYAGNSFEEKKNVASATNYLLKNGTLNRSAFQLNEDFDYYGAYSNRACYNETASVTLHTLTKHLNKLLPVVNDMLNNAVFPEEELEIFKKNSKQRLEVNMQKCEFVASRMIDACLYGEDHPYGRFTMKEDLDALTREDLAAFYKKYYVEGNCILFVAGKLPENLPQKLNEHFGKLTIGKPLFNEIVAPAHPSAQKFYRIENDPASVQGAIRMASPFPNRHHPDFKKAVVLNNVFGGFFGSRLMTNIREEKGYTYGIHSYLQNHLQQSAWMISTEAGRDVCEATIAEVKKEMQLLRDEEVDAEELLLVKNFMIGGLLGDLDGPFHIIAKWKNIILNSLTESWFYESVDAIKTTTAADLQELANKYLQPEYFYEMIVY